MNAVPVMDENIAERLRYCSTLPSIPGVAARIVDLANQPDSSMTQICDCVSMDPALSAKFLKVARSPLYMTRRAATNLRQAISLLGTQASIMIALSFSLVQSNRHAPGTAHLDRNHFWRRSLLSALACRALGEHLGLKKLDDLFLAGLLQDIGILVLDAMMPDEYGRVNSPALSHDALLAAERAAFGAGHDEVGYWLLKRWKLPDYLALASLAKHSLTREPEAMSKMTACIAVSGDIADHFLDPANQEVTTIARQSAAQLLQMNDDAFVTVLDALASRLPAAGDLFDIDILSPAEANGLMSEARDLQMLRQLSQARDLEQSAVRDVLTGAHSRAHLETMLRREFELAARHNWPLSVVVLDLDRFRFVNESFGQAVGDAVLISIVRSLQSQLRPDDLFARHGGEEFVIVLPGVGLEPTLKLLTRLKDSLASLDHTSSNGAPLKVSASFGAASHMDGPTPFKEANELLRAAQEALQTAKNAGRNRIEAWRGHGDQ